jgi:C1A family cysteine protease
MLNALSILLLLAVTQAADLDAKGVPVADKFAMFKAQFSKSYTTAELEASAEAAFAANEQTIIEHNLLGLSYWLGHNTFSDLTWEEFTSTHLGSLTGLAARPKKYDFSLLSKTVNDTSWDWTTKGAVTPIKNQGNCGSCWAFSTTGALEGAYAIAGNNLTSFSEEELVQCDNKAHHGGGNKGCQGGLELNAYVFISKNGLCTEAEYPYNSGTTNKTGGCKETCKPFVTLTGHTDVPHESGILAAIQQQPVSVNIEADKNAFHLYKGGVLDNPKCGRQIDHAVLVVGYGTAVNATNSSASKPYYKVKNSWGTSWGEAGFVRIVRDRDMCGIASSPTMPTGAKRWTPPTPAPPTPPTPPTPPPPPTACVGDAPKWCLPMYNCSGSSSLSKGECVAWQAIYDGLHQPGGNPWKNCEDSRADPCACGSEEKDAIVLCTNGHIHTVNLGQMDLEGTISDAVGKLTELTELALSNNVLHGSIPESICQLSNLKVIAAGGEDLGAKTHGLHGTIPACLGNLTNLESIELFHNRLVGTIPPELAKLANLDVFYLYNNLLSGRVPDLPVFGKQYCGIGDSEGKDDGNYYCKPIPEKAHKCNLEGGIRLRGNCTKPPSI